MARAAEKGEKQTVTLEARSQVELLIHGFNPNTGRFRVSGLKGLSVYTMSIKALPARGGVTLTPAGGARSPRYTHASGWGQVTRVSVSVMHLWHSVRRHDGDATKRDLGWQITGMTLFVQQNAQQFVHFT